MSNVINKKTLQYLKSVHTPDYPKVDWLVNPVLPKCAAKYWKIKSRKVVAMTKVEKAKVDSDLAEKVVALEKAHIRENLIRTRMIKIAKDQLVKEGIIEEIRVNEDNSILIRSI